MEVTKNRSMMVAYVVMGALVAIALVAGIAGKSGAFQTDNRAQSVEVSHIQASAAQETVEAPRTVAAPEIQLVGVAGTTGKKTAAFAGCIFGVGVPIGAAWGIATNPAAWAWVLGKGPFPASVGGGLYKYMDTVKRMCAYALR